MKKYSYLTDASLSKGDIVLKIANLNKIYLINEEMNDDYYASIFDYVIRPTKLSSKFFLYLTSETGKILFDLLQVGSYMEEIKLKDLLEFPIIYPEKSEEEYREIFLLQQYKINDLSKFYNVERLEEMKHEKIEDILAFELINKLIKIEKKMFMTLLFQILKN